MTPNKLGLRQKVKIIEIQEFKYYSEIFPFRLLFVHILANLLSKLLYIGANIVSVIALDLVLNGDYLWYGIKWLQWSQLDNSAAYDYMGARETPKPGK